MNDPQRDVECPDVDLDWLGRDDLVDRDLTPAVADLILGGCSAVTPEEAEERLALLRLEGRL